ncbi:hypothetical protein [Marinobacterium rhizophilum]|nr:hypothetical protein [Marinobacterium rhizophilum]
MSPETIVSQRRLHPGSARRVMDAWLLGIDPSAEPIDETAVQEVEISR